MLNVAGVRFGPGIRGFRRNSGEKRGFRGFSPMSFSMPFNRFHVPACTPLLFFRKIDLFHFGLAGTTFREVPFWDSGEKPRFCPVSERFHPFSVPLIVFYAVFSMF